MFDDVLAYLPKIWEVLKVLNCMATFIGNAVGVGCNHARLLFATYSFTIEDILTWDYTQAFWKYSIIVTQFLLALLVLYFLIKYYAKSAYSKFRSTAVRSFSGIIMGGLLVSMQLPLERCPLHPPTLRVVFNETAYDMPMNKTVNCTGCPTEGNNIFHLEGQECPKACFNFVVLYQHGAVDAEACLAHYVPWKEASQKFQQQHAGSTDQKEQACPHKQTDETDELKTCPHKQTDETDNSNSRHFTASWQPAKLSYSTPFSRHFTVPWQPANEPQTTPAAQCVECTEFYARCTEFYAWIWTVFENWILPYWQMAVQAFCDMRDHVSNEIGMKIDWFFVQVIAREKCSEINKQTHVFGCNINFLLHSPQYKAEVTTRMLLLHDRRIRCTYMIFKEILPSLLRLMVFAWLSIANFFMTSWNDFYELYSTRKHVTIVQWVSLTMSMGSGFTMAECEFKTLMASMEKVIHQRIRLGMAVGQEPRRMKFRDGWPAAHAVLGWNFQVQQQVRGEDSYKSVGDLIDHTGKIKRTVSRFVFTCIYSIVACIFQPIVGLLRATLSLNHMNLLTGAVMQMGQTIMFAIVVIYLLVCQKDERLRQLEALRTPV